MQKRWNRWFWNCFRPENKKGPEAPLISLDQFAEGTFSTWYRTQEKRKRRSYNYKTSEFDLYRANEGFNKLVFQEILGSLFLSCQREQFFGTQGVFANPIIDTPYSRRVHIYKALFKEEENKLIEEGARFGLQVEA